MFIKIFSKERNDFVEVIECERYSSVTSEKDKNTMEFFVYSNKNNCEEFPVDKRYNYVYIENSEGKTVGSYKWQYDEKRNVHIRM